MGYSDPDFWRQYEGYLTEAPVVARHQWAVNSLFEFDLQQVLDLGCGKCSEFLRYHRPRSYAGVDRYAKVRTMANHLGGHDYWRRGDYRTDLGRIVRELPFCPDAFVSLFSVECTAGFQDNYLLYHRVFADYPTIRAGLVSGFYYAGRREQETVQEPGGIVSYQSCRPVDPVLDPLFEERRVIFHSPSALFGDDVYEVWKLLIRSGSE